MSSELNIEFSDWKTILSERLSLNFKNLQYDIAYLTIEVEDFFDDILFEIKVEAPELFLVTECDNIPSYWLARKDQNIGSTYIVQNSELAKNYFDTDTWLKHYVISITDDDCIEIISSTEPIISIKNNIT